MKKAVLYILIYLGISNNFEAYSQKDTVSNWKKSLQTGANLNQASFSSNWKGGGTNSFAVGLFSNSKAVYETKKISFANEVQLQYGFMNSKLTGNRKTADKIYLDSKLGWKINEKINFYASLNFLSQFAKGYVYKKDTQGDEYGTVISLFMSPGYLTSSLGMEYRPAKYLWMRFGTGTLRQTFVLDTNIYKAEPKNYGVPVGKKFRNQAAFQYLLSFDKEILKNLNLKVQYLAFVDYQDFKAIDNRLDLTISAKVNKLINVAIYATTIYDQDMDFKIQYTQTLAIGILYNFSQFK
jgi:hypothetical protein